MKVLIVGSTGGDYFNDDTFTKCMADLIIDKDDHCGKRSAISGTTISSIIVPGRFAPVEVTRWATEREIDLRKLTNDGDFYAMLTKGIECLSAGDALLVFSPDRRHPESQGALSAGKRARRRVYEFAWSRERGWSLMLAKEKPSSGSLF